MEKNKSTTTNSTGGKKVFDWEHCKKTRSPRVYEWLLENYEKPVTEEHFVQEVGKFRGERIGKSYEYTPSSLKQGYRRLKANFGFFSLPAKKKGK